MQPRHLKLLLSFALLFSLCVSGGLYLFVAFHYGHVWSLFFIVMTHFCMLIAPAICFGYDDPADFKPSHMSDDTHRNQRDMGYVAAGIFYLLSYVPTTVAWYATDTLRPPMGGVVCVYIGNFACLTAYVLWLRQFVFV